MVDLTEKGEDRAILFLSLSLLVLCVGLMNNYSLFDSTGMESVTGAATTANALTSAVIANYFAINASANLTTDGIRFYITSLPTANLSASGNINYAGGGMTNGTQTYLSVEKDSNVNVRFCIKSNDSLRSGANSIDVGLYYWSNSTVNNGTMPHLTTALSRGYPFGASSNGSSYAKVNDPVTPGSDEYFRFWLSVNSAQNPGTYTNQINFKGVQTGTAC
ncbi:MAG: hypothetical protein WC471_05805 [Candidatus Woesearchaeota archaeon]